MRAKEILEWYEMEQGTASKRHIIEIARAADDGGTLQAEDMLALFPGRPELHSAATMKTALLAAGCKLSDEMEGP